MPDAAATPEVQFSRRDQTSGELRGDCPREILNALDAVSLARDMTRTQLVNEILGKWAERKRHELSLLAKLDGGNARRADACGEVR